MRGPRRPPDRSRRTSRDLEGEGHVGSAVMSNGLAILGHAPAFRHPRHVGQPNIGDRQVLMERIEQILDRRWLTNGGPMVDEFEAAVASTMGVRHCVAMCNGTVALEIAIRAAGLSGEVITTPFTFIATAHALQWQGITPVFCDIDATSHNIDPRLVERLITPRTSGIIGVHLWGRACDVDALSDVADRHGLHLLFDAAHAFGSSHRGRMVGSFGVAEVLSFHATKFVNAFEGGAVVTNDDALAERARLMRNFGFADYDDVVSLGTNGKMTEIAAAMGLTSIESMSAFIDVNRRNLEAYRRELSGIQGLTVMADPADGTTTKQYVVVEVDETAGLTRDDLQRVLRAENVLARRYFFPGCHRQEPYRSRCRTDEFPVADRVAARLLTLPTGTGTTPEDIVVIADVVRRALAGGPGLAAAIRDAPDAEPGDGGRGDAAGRRGHP